MSKFLPYFVCVVKAHQQSLMEKDRTRSRLDEHIQKQRQFKERFNTLERKLGSKEKEFEKAQEMYLQKECKYKFRQELDAETLKKFRENKCAKFSRPRTDRNNQTLPEREYEVSSIEEEDKIASKSALRQEIRDLKDKVILKVRPSRAELEEGEIPQSSSEKTESDKEMQLETSAIGQTEAIPETLEASIQIVKKVRVSRFSDYPPTILPPIK